MVTVRQLDSSRGDVNDPLIDNRYLLCMHGCCFLVNAQDNFDSFDLVFICEVVANLIFLIAITNLELSKVGVFMAPALSALIAIKLMKQKPSIANWLGIAATSSAPAIIALN